MTVALEQSYLDDRSDVNAEKREREKHNARRFQRRQ
jgi:hypothetical protein